MKKKTKEQRITIRISNGQLRALQLRAKKQGITLGAVVRGLIRVG